MVGLFSTKLFDLLKFPFMENRYQSFKKLCTESKATSIFYIIAIVIEDTMFE